MALFAICFPLLMGAFLLVMERLEVVLLPARSPAAPPPEVLPADGAAPGGRAVPGPRPSPEQEADPLAA